MKKRLIFIIISLMIFTGIFSAALFAEDEEENAPSEAEQLEISLKGAKGTDKLLDGDEESYKQFDKNTELTVSSDIGIAQLYVVFDKIPAPYEISDGEESFTVGENGFLHEYIDIKTLFGYTPEKVTLRFAEKTSVSEISAFAEGTPPAWVQIWQPPCETADLLLASTHIDDEQLFFAGILPYFAGELGLNVQVVYFTDPYQYHDRPHEQLNGLWHVGVRNYPVMGEFVDKYSETKKDAYAHQEKIGFTKEEIIDFQVEMLRRFRPLVVIGHDFDGEYSHGQHMINAETLTEALPLAADESYHTESASRYGVWDTPKCYIHLYEENEIVMDWDIPLEKFGGKTAFEMTQEGFMFHKSQHWTWFYGWIFGKNGNKITKAAEIKKHSPCEYGLYRTKVGLDTGIGDMFENLMTYGELEAEKLRLEEESRAAESESIRLLEESRAAAEAESIRLEEESRAAESERLRREEESRAAAEAERIRLEKEAKNSKSGIITAVIAAVGICFGVLLMIPQMKPKKSKKKLRRK